VSVTPLLFPTLIVILTLAILGGRPERTAAVLFAALNFLTPFLQPLIMGQTRWGVALTSVFTFGGLLWLALRSDRWWLVFAAGCQLLALSTHIITLLQIDSLIWTAVTLRWISWGGVLVCALFGLWEGRAVDRLRRSARGADDDAEPIRKNLQRSRES